MTDVLERLAHALPEVMDQPATDELYGPGYDPLNVPEEWYRTPREMATAIIANLPADVILTDIGKLAAALPDWMVEHPGARSENELRLIIAGMIAQRLRDQQKY